MATVLILRFKTGSLSMVIMTKAHMLIVADAEFIYRFIGQGLSYIGDIMINGVLGQKENGLMVVNPVMIFLLDQTMPDQDVNDM